MKYRSFFLKVLLIVSLLFLSNHARAAEFEVEIVDSEFIPATLTINVGDTVTWVEHGTMGHTTTSDDGLWNSPVLPLNQTFSHTFAAAGSFGYHCSPHPFMTGTIIVEESTPALPIVAITAPANNSTLEPGEVTIEATASMEGGTISMVQFFDGTTDLGMDHEAPYSVVATLEAGSHSLTARATAGTGEVATSDAITVTVTAGSNAIDDPFPALVAKGDHRVELQPVATGLVAPLGMAALDDGSGRKFVYDQTGVIYLMTNGALSETLVLDISDRLVPLRENYDERGLLGLAAHLNFAENPFIYTYTSEPTGPTADFVVVPPEGATNNHQSVIAEWRIDAENTNQVDVTSRREIMRIDEPQSNHNGGVMHFGPDGYLYISLGDGGAADDQGNGHSPQGNGQDTSNILGSMVRIDVDARTSPNGQYGVPSDSPFVGEDGVDEIYAYGFRNPFSWSFDKLTGELYVADVGQNKVEELNRVFIGGNYGWRIKEGRFYFDPNGDDPGFITSEPVTDVPDDLVDPIAEYDHDEGLAIVGGYVYRGTALPGFSGKYICGELGTFSDPLGRLFYLDRNIFREIRIGREDRALERWVKGFGEDADGELYLFASGRIGPRENTGEVLKLVPVENTLEILEVTPDGEDLMVHWTNALGTIVVQTTDSVENGTWRVVTASAATSAMIPMSGDAQFFRLIDTSGNGPIPFTAHLSGAAERPNPVDTPGTGSGTFSLEGNVLHFDIQYSGLKSAATAAHIHGPAAAAGAASVMIDFAPFHRQPLGTDGVISGSVILTAEQKATIMEGKTYVNVHSGAHTGGEIRGQIAPVLFAADLSGDAERPTPVDSPGHGSGLFLLVGTNLTFNIDYQDLKASATMAHIHGPAPASEAAGIMVDFGPFNNGGFATNGTISGTVGLTAAQLAALVDGLTYVNVHSTAHGSGEVRGQIYPQPTAIPLSATLTGAAERPTPVDTPATGTASFALEGNTLRFNVTYRGLKSAATMAHIHGPATAATAAGIMIHFTPFAGAGGLNTNGTFAGSVQLTDEQRALILEGRTYVNIHTDAHGSGEIRGQIVPVVHHTTLLGGSERLTPVHTTGRGRGTLLLVGDRLTFNVTYSDLSSAATMAHIHGPASIDEAAGVMVGLDGELGINGSFAGTVTLNGDQLAALIDGLTYVNVHSGTHGSGEIRGQITR